MFKNWNGITLAVALAWCPAMAFAGGDHNKESKTPAQIQQSLNDMDKPLTELVRAAEAKTGGKAFCATICEWGKVQPKFNQAGSQVISGTKADTAKFAPNHTVGVVKVHANNKIIAAVVCSTTGEVLATKDMDKYEPGRTAYVDDDRNTYAGMSNTGQGHQPGNLSNTGQNPNQNSNTGMAGNRTNPGDTSRMVSTGDSSRNYYDRWNQAPTRWQKAEDIIGKDVTNRATNEKVGEVKDLAVDPDTGRVIFAVVEFDSKMGHGDRWYAMPLASTTLTPDAKSIQIDYSTAQMNEANGFDSKNWPNITDEQWTTKVHSNFSQTPYWKYPEARQSGSTVRVSHTDSSTSMAPRRWQKMNDLIGKEVKNQQNESLGTIKDVALDPDSGRILYGVLSFGGFLGLGDKYFAIPWSALQLTPDAKHVVLAIEKDRLKNAEGFDKNSWPNMADERWATNVYQFYNRPTYWNQSSQSNQNQNLSNQNALRENGDNP